MTDADDHVSPTSARRSVGRLERRKTVVSGLAAARGHGTKADRGRQTDGGKPPDRSGRLAVRDGAPGSRRQDGR